MPSQATAPVEPGCDSWPGSAFEELRAHVVRTYQPATSEEMMLANQIARAWYRLHKYQDLEAALIEKQQLAELFETDLARFNALQRAISGAERMWRDAVRQFHAARRRGAPPASPMLHVVSRRPAAEPAGAPRPVSASTPNPASQAPLTPPAPPPSATPTNKPRSPVSIPPPSPSRKRWP